LTPQRQEKINDDPALADGEPAHIRALSDSPRGYRPDSLESQPGHLGSFRKGGLHREPSADG
jgi:hypothetical protein